MSVEVERARAHDVTGEVMMRSGRTRFKGLVVATALAFFVSPVNATPVTFEVALVVTEVFRQAPFPDCLPSSDVFGRRFGCDNHTGDFYIGSFSFDDSYLATNGIFDVPMSTVNFVIDTATWQTTVGILGHFLLGGPRGSFTLQIQNGTVIDLIGAVLGPASSDHDRIFFDGNRTFDASDGASTELGGVLGIRRIPEPPAIALLVVSALGMGLVRRRPRLWPPLVVMA